MDKKNKRNVVVGGPYYGCHNIGDESILFSILCSLHADTTLSVCTFSSDWIKEKFNDVDIRKIVIEYSKPKLGLFIDPKRRIVRNSIALFKEIHFYKTAYLYLCGGGTILSDCPWYSLRTIQVAGWAGIPSVMWGVGMAEIEDERTKKYITKVLNKKYVTKVFTRDQFVKDRLISMGVDKNKIQVSYDPAIMINGKAFDLQKYFSKDQQTILNNGRKNVVLSISGETDVINKTPIEEIISAARIIQEDNMNIVLIPTGCGAHCKDIDFIKTIANQLDHSKTVLVEREFEPEHLIEFLKSVEYIISSRLHMNIFGACAGVPSIGLVRNQKIIDFAQLLNLPYLQLDTLEGKALYESATNISANIEYYKKNIKTRVDEMRHVYEIALDELKQKYLT